MAEKQPPITAESITAYLDSRDDFELEIFAYRTLREKGWNASIGGTYRDSLTGKPRQFDVRGNKGIVPRCEVSLAVECKSLTVESPLIVSRIPRPANEAQGHDLILRWYRREIGDAAFSVERAAPERLQLYASGEMVGKQTAQLRYRGAELISSDTETYEKWSQALSSAVGLIESAATTKVSDPVPHVTFVMPVLLVNNQTLWVVDYDISGSRNTPTQVDDALLSVDREHAVDGRYGSPTYTMTHLHIYTRTGFERMVKDYTSPTGHMFDKTFSSMIRKNPAIVAR